MDTIGVVCAFIHQQPPHSKYNIQTLIDSLTAMPSCAIVAIANGCELSPQMRDFFQMHPRVNLIEVHPNIGVPAAWNLGIDCIECDYLFIMNDDLWCDEYCISELVSLFKTMPDTAVAGVEGVKCVSVDDKGFPRQKVRYGKKKTFFKRPKIIDVSNVSGFLFALSMDFVKKTAFRFDTQYSPAFCEEFDLAFFARDHGYKVRIRTDLADHYEHSFGISDSPSSVIHYLGKKISPVELSRRNMALFSEKWHMKMSQLVKP